LLDVDNLVRGKATAPSHSTALFILGFYNLEILAETSTSIERIPALVSGT
jgi:hypothetical protein